MRIDDLLDNPHDPRVQLIVRGLSALFRGKFDDAALTAWADYRKAELEKYDRFASAASGWGFVTPAGATRVDGVRVAQDHSGRYNSAGRVTNPPTWVAAVQDVFYGGASPGVELPGVSTVHEAMSAADIRLPLPAWRLAMSQR